MKHFCICSASGNGETALTSFDNALLHSGLANYNLLKVSSILPARAIQRETVDLPEGSILYTAYASKTMISKTLVSAAVAVGIPLERDKIGVIMEFSGECGKNEAKDKVCQMVKEAMRARGYEINEILCAATEVLGSDGKYSTAFAALSMW